MTDFIKFPSINQYRNTIKWVREGCEFHSRKAPTIPFVGTVKLHGTNAAIAKSGGGIWFQSRNRILSPDDDNAGFAARMSALPDEVAELLSIGDEAVVFGEWCGQGIQRGVAINELPKMFVIFAAAVGHEWIDLAAVPSFPDSLIFKITDFPTFALDVDFEKPELAQEKLGEITLAVEQECPVGKHFGVSGLGEGVVWRPADYTLQGSEYWFKVKGEKHSVSKVKTLAPVDVEMIARRDDLIAAIVTDNRLAQGLDHLTREMKLDIEMKNIGIYLRWVFNDAIKEEADTIEASGFTIKELGSPISVHAKRYFMAAMNERMAA